MADTQTEPQLDVSITEDSLDVGGAIALASSPDIGGIGVFVGTVRVTPAVEGNEDKAVVGLTYEAHPTLAEAKLEEIARAAAQRWEVVRIVAWHRTGACEIGEPTVVIACGAAHRGDALEACRWIIDEVKSGVPIWKREQYADGSSWVGAGG